MREDTDGRPSVSSPCCRPRTRPGSPRRSGCWWWAAGLALAPVTHPAVAQIHGVESWLGRPFLVVEFLAGGTLEDRLRDGPIAPAQAVSLVARLADALAALHAQGCLHGDVKPSNIGCTAEGSPTLLYFWVAHAVDDAAMVGGTLPYLSPEVLAGRRLRDRVATFFHPACPVPSSQTSLER